MFGADGTKIAIECDGDYWHGDEQFEKDMQRQEILERAGWQFSFNRTEWKSHN
jgi:very-short-patch-repair endonuclease